MNCKVCGKPVKSWRKYCSQKCYKTDLKGKQIKPRTKACIQCGKVIDCFPGRKRKFCSSECTVKYRTGKERPEMWKRITLVCPVCKKEFETGGRLKRGKIYCSIECSSKANQKNLRKQIGGEAWIRLAKSIRERDHNTCVMCGKTPANQVHHVIPRTYSYHPNRYSGQEKPEELITLCVRCHNILDGANALGYKHNPAFDPWQLIKLLQNK